MRSEVSKVSSLRTIGRLAIVAALVAGTVAIAAPAQAAGSITAFTVEIDPDDGLGSGQTFTFTPTNATVAAQPSGAGGVSMSAIQGDYVHWYYASVSPPVGQTFSAGTTYSTERFATDSAAGLDVSGDGSGCNESTGTLKILELTFADGGATVDSFAATYEQHCYNYALYGELRYQSSVDFVAMVVVPLTVDFGSQPLVPSDPTPVTITNTGTVSLTLGAATITGAQSLDFSLVSDTCSSESVSAGGSCSIGVVFTPSDIGTSTATLQLSANTARGGVEIDLIGTGQKLLTPVTLATSRTRVSLNDSVKVTAHLVAFQDTLSKQLKIYATPYGGSKKLIKSGNVNSSGNLSVTISLTKRTAFVATFAGDAAFVASASGAKTVYVYPVVKGSLVKYYGTSGAYRLYHYTSKCPGAHTGCPSYVVSVKPNHSGSSVYITLQIYASGAWRTALTGKYRLNSKSKAKIIFIYRDRGIIRYSTRVRARFPGDADHLARSSTWSYFRVTN